MQEGVPFAPRMDIWYYSNSYKGILPEKFKGLSLKQIVKNLDLTYNKILPDFSDNYNIISLQNRLLGIFSSRDIPYDVALDPSFKTIVNNDNGLIRVKYELPESNLSGSFLMDETLKKQGSTLPPIKEHLIKSEDDYSKVMDIFASVKVIPKPENYRMSLEAVGDEGFPPVYGYLAASPMHAVLRDLMDPSFFYIEYKLNLKKLLALCKVLESFLLSILKTVTECAKKPIVVWGGNYDSMLTFPPFFREHILPFLNNVCEIIHEKGGLVISHCDGENNQLLELYRQSGIDILQAVSTAPMVKNTYREIRDSLRPEQVICGGIPSTILFKSSFSDTQFKNFLAEFKKSYRRGEPLILEVSDNVLPDAEIDRLETIREFARSL